MSPYEIDQNIDYRKLQSLSDELFQFWQGLHAFYLDSVAGFELVRSRAESSQIQLKSFTRDSEEDIESLTRSCHFSYAQIFSREFCASGMHRATHGETMERNSPGGSNYVLLGQLCLVAFSAYWNDYLRKEYVIAKGRLSQSEADEKIIKGCLRDNASADLWGDINKLRNSIVHNQGVVSKKYAAFKLIKWFSPGDKISISPDQMRAIFIGVLQFRNDLFKEGFPKLYIRIPG